jgi:hypothetical protein
VRYDPLLTFILKFTALTTAFKLCKHLSDQRNNNMTFHHVAAKQTGSLALVLRTLIFLNFPAPPPRALKFSYCLQLSVKFHYSIKDSKVEIVNTLSPFAANCSTLFLVITCINTYKSPTGFSSMCKCVVSAPQDLRCLRAVKL